MPLLGYIRKILLYPGWFFYISSRILEYLAMAGILKKHSYQLYSIKLITICILEVAEGVERLTFNQHDRGV